MVDHPGARATAYGTLAAAFLLLGSGIIPRPFDAVIQATAVLNVLVLALLTAPLLVLAVGTYRLATTRHAQGRSLAAGSAIKVAVVTTLGVGLLGALSTFVAPFSGLIGLFPAPHAGALVLMRAGLALPAIGIGLCLAAGLLVVDRPAAVLPGLLMFVVVELVLTALWIDVGAGPNLELAGAGLAWPIAALLGAVTGGTLLLAAASARGELGIHLSRPFDIKDLFQLVRLGLPALLPTVVFPVLAGLYSVAVMTGDRGPEAAIVGVLLFPAGLLVVAAGELVLRSEPGRGRLGWGILGLLLAAGVLLLVAPGLVRSALTQGSEASLAGIRLLGAGLLHEIGLALATRLGWLRMRSTGQWEWLALCLTAIPLTVLMVILGIQSVTVVTLGWIVCRAVTVPFLRR